jgi:hypothetical protein
MRYIILAPLPRDIHIGARLQSVWWGPPPHPFLNFGPFDTVYIKYTGDFLTVYLQLVTLTLQSPVPHQLLERVQCAI